jgi:hypothetical protein
MPKANETGVFYAILLETKLSKVEIEQLITFLNKHDVPINKTWAPLHVHDHFNVTKEKRGIPWQDKEYDGKMKSVCYKELNLEKANYYCSSRILELYIHPPNNEENIKSIIEYLM